MAAGVVSFASAVRYTDGRNAASDRVIRFTLAAARFIGSGEQSHG